MDVLHKKETSASDEISGPLLESGSCEGAWLKVSFWWVFGVIILFIGIAPSLMGFAGLRLSQGTPEYLKMALATYPMQLALLAAAAVPACLIDRKTPLHAKLLAAPPTLKQTLAMAALLCVLLPALAAVALGFKGLLTAFGVEAREQLAIKIALKAGPEGFAALAAGAVLLAPFAEEFAFRRVIFSFLRGIAGTFPAAALTSAIFASTHLSLLQFPSLFLLGLALQFVCLRCNSLTPAITLHMLNNAAAMAALLFMRHAGC